MESLKGPGPGLEPGSWDPQSLREFKEETKRKEARRLEKSEFLNDKIIEEFLSRYKKEHRSGYKTKIKRFQREIKDLSREEFIRWRDKYQFEPYGKNLFKDLKVFLRWLAERFDEPTFEEYAKLLKWKGKKTKKLYTEEEKAITLEKLRRAIDVILSGRWRKNELKDAFLKLRAIAAIVLGASTGLRPFEIYRIEDNQIREGVKKRYFILPEDFTKTPFERLIPINKESHWILSNLMEVWENKKLRKRIQIQSKKVFSKDTITDVIKKRVSGIEVDNLRDFEVDYSMNKLGVPGFLEAIIAGHDTEKYAVRIENYLKGKVTKESIRDDWLKYWDKVEILTKEQRKKIEKLVKSTLK